MQVVHHVEILLAAEQIRRCRPVDAAAALVVDKQTREFVERIAVENRGAADTYIISRRVGSRHDSDFHRCRRYVRYRKFEPAVVGRRERRGLELLLRQRCGRVALIVESECEQNVFGAWNKAVFLLCNVARRDEVVVRIVVSLHGEYVNCLLDIFDVLRYGLVVAAPFFVGRLGYDVVEEGRCLVARRNEKRCARLSYVGDINGERELCLDGGIGLDEHFLDFARLDAVRTQSVGVEIVLRFGRQSRIGHRAVTLALISGDDFGDGRVCRGRLVLEKYHVVSQQIGIRAEFGIVVGFGDYECDVRLRLVRWHAFDREARVALLLDGEGERQPLFGFGFRLRLGRRGRFAARQHYCRRQRQ